MKAGMTRKEALVSHAPKQIQLNRFHLLLWSYVWNFAIILYDLGVLNKLCQIAFLVQLDF
ncbi:hypothetical protein OUY_05570 [Wolbachia endosymbiont of Leptopilina clavipes]|nr:hypothetical protein OUY_05570 [Wolbachia endosymbiont of Leptopilina clavipes]